MQEDFTLLEKTMTEMASPGIRPGLARLARLLWEDGMPQKKFPAVHIAGTNGKGSTAASLYSILRKSGCKTALYTSPHLVSFGERLLIDERNVSAKKWFEAVAKIKSIIEKVSFFKNDLPTYFEIVTAAAIMILADEKPDITVFETGMGGRLDASNILGNVKLSIITPIGIDHTEYLGDTIEKIAAEKFAILRRNTPALFVGDRRTDFEIVSSTQQSNIGCLRKTSGLNGIFMDRAETVGAKPHIFSEEYSIRSKKFAVTGTDFELAGAYTEKYHTPLIGTFQAENTALAIAAAKILKKEFPKITDSAIARGVSETQWGGRMEIVLKSPLVIFDGGHNPHAMCRIAETLKKLLPNQKISVVIAMMKDKAISESLSYFSDREINAEFYCTQVPDYPRSLSAAEMKTKVEGADLISAGSFSEPYDALRNALKNSSTVLCCGSLYFIGYMKEHINELSRV